MTGNKADAAWVADCVREITARCASRKNRSRLAGLIREPEIPPAEKIPEKRYRSEYKSVAKVRSRKRLTINNSIKPIFPGLANSESRTLEEHNDIVNNMRRDIPDERGSGEIPDAIGRYLILHAISQIDPKITRPECPYIDGMHVSSHHSRGRRAVATA